MNLNKKNSGFRCTLCILMMLCGLSISGAIGQSKIIDKVVSKIGSELVLLSDLEDQYQYIAKQQTGITPTAKCNIMENLIAQKVIIYQAKLDSVEVTDLELDAQLDYRFESILRQMNGDEEFFKEYYGFTVSEMRDRVREDQKQQILSEKMQGKLIGSVKITPKEVEEFYNLIPSDSLPYLNSEVEISELVMQPLVNMEERKKTLDKITEIRADILAEKISFEEAAKKFSADGSAAKGGDLGFAKRGIYVPAFEAAAFQLKKDEISEIVETEFGFHIIQLIERRGNSIHVRHVLLSPKITASDEEKANRVLDSIRTLITLDSMTFEQAVKRHSLEDVQSYGNSGRIKNPKTGNTFFETSDLDPDIYFEIIDLDPGQISNVFESTDIRGKKQFKIIKVNSESKPHKANLEQDYNKIALFAKESKKNNYFNDWVSQKMDETYIKVDQNYDFCENLIQWIDTESKP